MVKKMHRDTYLANTSTLAIDKTKCIGCRLCMMVCPHGVWQLEQNKAAIIDLNACMECSACAMNCVKGAITVRRGVGCANAIIKTAIGLSKTDTCC